MILFSDFKKADGSLDWDAYRAAKNIEHKAEVAEGKYCYQCDRYLLWPKGHRELCSECKEVNGPGECSHHRYVRCPKCGRHFDPGEQDYYSLYEGGEHKVTCGDCSHQFEVSTRVSYTFTSPARIEGSTPE